MKWTPAPDWLIAAFDPLVPDDPRVERRKMFGYPCAFACDNMFIGLHRDNLVMRLGEADRERFLAEEKSEIFSPFPGRLMREYVVVPHALIRKRTATLEEWIGRSLEYAASLPARSKKAKAAAPKAAAKKPQAGIAKPAAKPAAKPVKPAKKAPAPSAPRRAKKS
ncbi:MAG TPA: TfoX/Sxy family protein [Thermoanaerobaculia bacterium]|nr:TfoX/Sxy family protein [Thermoanaerobaculia bacterium]